MQRQLVEAEYKGHFEDAERLRDEIDAENWEEWEERDNRYKVRQVKISNHKSRIQKLVDQEKAVIDEYLAIGLVPNYKFSPRDLFVAFVTRSIKRSNSLDIICRHWAPKLDKDDGADELPSWISSLFKAPYGILGSSQGRQNGENLVSYLPHDQRKRYSASGTTQTDLKMLIDPRLSWKGITSKDKRSKSPPPGSRFSIFTMSKEPSIISQISVPDSLNNINVMGLSQVKEDSGKPADAGFDGSESDHGSSFNEDNHLGSSATAPTQPSTTRGRRSPEPLPSPAAAVGKSWSFGTPGESKMSETIKRSLRNLGPNRKAKSPISSANTTPVKPVRQSTQPEFPTQPRTDPTFPLLHNDKGKQPDTNNDAFSSHRNSTSAPGTFTPPAKVETAHIHAADNIENGPRTAIPSTAQRLAINSMVANSQGQMHGSHPIPKTPIGGTPSKKHDFNTMPAPLSAWNPPHRLSGILLVKGFILGRIKDQSEVMRGGVIPGEWVSKLGWKKNEDTENRVPDTLWRLLVADRMPQGGRPPQWYKRACLHGLVDGRVSDNYGNIHTATSSQRKIGELTMRYFKRVESVVWQRRIFELDTFDGLFGLGPEGSKVGDVVCILYGCSVPVLLKRVKNPRVEDLFEVVGETYVHGMMDGEAMDFTEEWKPQVREFRLG
ncbi:hypothetical protein B0T21DRAFT_366576 [Apiosordaria backusii]|uniref:Uncharacterized protein n=1 Tax=Apiosordaria backusii TaxID=314023 RepID=A0AA40EDT5_9PEZI|nr:hypothetical protein B0T21DRAFT_366576 [Apiosordaria backusii]